MLKNKLENAPRLFRYVLSATDMIDAAKAYELEMPEYIGWTVSEIELMRLKKEIEAMDGQSLKCQKIQF